jgi:hypothetical protein
VVIGRKSASGIQTSVAAYASDVDDDLRGRMDGGRADRV